MGGGAGGRAGCHIPVRSYSRHFTDCAKTSLFTCDTRGKFQPFCDSFSRRDAFQEPSQARVTVKALAGMPLNRVSFLNE